MFKFIKDFILFLKQREERKIACKRYMITQAMIKYYEDLQATRDEVDLPPYILAVNAMKELKTSKDVNRIYRKLELAGVV